jgi:hypothetical protein
MVKNKVITRRNRKFANGGGLPSWLSGGLANTGANLISGFANPQGNTTGVGNIMQGVGSVASAIPGVGGLIGAGVNLVGGLVNAAFGSKINKEFVNQTENKAIQQSNYVSGATTNDQLLSDWGDYRSMANVSKSQVGSDGWFSNKAKKKTRALNRQIDEANQRALSSLGNTAGNIDIISDQSLLANYAAYGGPLGTIGGQALNYELANRELNNSELKAMGNLRLTSLPNSFQAVDELNTFAEGGGIHIKKKNRGKFTEYCGGKVTSECIARGKRSNSPTIRKRATFAQNARGWNHSFGGWLNTHGGDFNNGVTIIDEGGTHEQNPNEGVQIGVDQQGVPNLVEQGEVIYNDYVFSNRIKLPESIKKKYKLKGDTFADAAKYAQLESQERPNDPISKRGLEANMSRLAEAQEGIKNRRGKGDTNKFEYGGPYKTYKNFTPIQDDWYTGDYMNFVNFLQEGEPSSLNWLKRINSQEFGPIGGNTFTDISDIKRLATDRKKGPVHNAMQAASRTYKIENTPLSEPVAPSFNIPTPPVPKSISPQSPISSGDEDDSGRRERASWLRYAPIVGAGIGVITDMFSRPDYENADLVLNSTKNLGNVDFTPIGNYLSYQPFDRNYYINKLDASSNTTRRGLQNTSGGNRANMQAGLLAADYNYGQNLGDLARKAEEYNLAQRQQVEGFNRGTNQFNSEGAMRAAIANRQNDELRMRAAMSAAQLRQAIKDQYDARKSTNMTNFLQGLGDIGWEQEQASWLDTLAKSGVLKMNTKGEYTGGTKKAKGGKVRTKKKKGLTYG